MKLVVGLGNPGKQYEKTRHNIGFQVIDRLVERWAVGVAPKVRDQGIVWQTTVKGCPTLLLKPQTYMNLSGRSVAPFYRFFQCQPQDLIVVYDELDLPPCQVRIKKGGGAGGHNGIKSLLEHLGKDQEGFLRVRFGIGHPRGQIPSIDVSDYVLMPFFKTEMEQVEPALERASTIVEHLVLGQVTEAMNLFHGR